MLGARHALRRLYRFASERSASFHQGTAVIAIFDNSAEAPDQRGLAIFPGAVQRFEIDARVPHMGWNEVDAVRPSRLLQGLPEHPHLYFAHSYYVPVVEQAAATCTYSIPYTAILESGNTFGVQCHPEKSGPLGLAIVRNFVELQ